LKAVVSTEIVIAGAGHKRGEVARSPSLFPDRDGRVKIAAARVHCDLDIIGRRIDIVVPNGL
jgi:hypothetical protein